LCFYKASIYENAGSLQPTCENARSLDGCRDDDSLVVLAENAGGHEIVSPGFMVINSVVTPRAFSSFWNASGVPVSKGNVA
jgi:hypothetical protein